MKKNSFIPHNMAWPFILLTFLFFAWALPNNLTDTMLAAFKRILSLPDSKTAWIQVVCYLFGYGFFAIPAALFIKKFSYKSGVILGLFMYAVGTFLFYPAMLESSSNTELSFLMFLFAILVLFAGLSILETSTNSYVCAIGDPSQATRRLNFTQSFNPFGAITGVVVSQVFILSRLNTLNAPERALLPPEELNKIQMVELSAVTETYMIVGVIMLLIMFAFIFTKMPKLKEDSSIDFKGTFKRLMSNSNYKWGVLAQFFYVGAQIAVWSFLIRYVMQQLKFDEVVSALGNNPPQTAIINALRNTEPLAKGFYNITEFMGVDSFLPKTSEQAGATYYILSLILFVVVRFLSTLLMKNIHPRKLLLFFSVLAVVLSFIVVYSTGFAGVYALIGLSGCMSLMFPTIYSFGVQGLGEDTKIGGAGMVMAISGAAILTQIQGSLSDELGSIHYAYWVPLLAFAVIVYYSFFIAKKYNVK